MGKHKHSHLPFQLDGQFVGFVVKDGYKVKELRLATAQGEQFIKLSKEARACCFPLPQPGVGMRVVGEQQIDKEDGTVKLKARQVTVLPLDALQLEGAIAPTPTFSQPSVPARATPAKAKACILVCQKSDCCKRGGRAVMATLERELEHRQLSGQITLRGTGCMKQCKAGPALVMPDKTRHTRVRPDEIPHLLERHGIGVGA